MSQTVVAIGLQQTGKTTFLAAFWDIIGSGEVVGSLQLEKTYGDMTYLNEIRAAWADYLKITRTGPASDKSVTMQLRNTRASADGQLVWSDMLGESFERQWTDRAWADSYGKVVEEAAGAMLFLHPLRTFESPLIIQSQKLLKRLEVESEQATEGEPGERTKHLIKFDARKVPTQVQIVEMLQFLTARRKSCATFKLAVVISAWDLVEKSLRVTPNQWLQERLPLLSQYLWSNDDRYESAVFGVSAQGCDYGHGEEEQFRKKYRRSSDRIKVVHGDEASNDITAPVRFALGFTPD
jgi:hypothetical protein